MNPAKFPLILGTLLFGFFMSVLPGAGLAQELSKIAIARPAPSVPGINLHVAKARGFFREEGLDAQLVQLSDVPAIKALTAGEVQAVSIVGSVVRAIEQDDAPFKVLSVDLKRPLFWLVARPEYKSIGDLKGKVFGIASRGSGPHLVAARLLRKGGLDPEKDIAVIVTKDTLQSLVSGEIQATVLFAPSVILARDKFKMNILAHSLDEFSLERGIAVRNDFLGEKRDLVKRMLRAQAKARRYVLENERGSSELLAHWTKVELPVAMESYRLAQPAFITDGIPSDEEVREYLKGRLSKPIPADRIFDFSLQREVNRELGIK